jgi:two-component system NtrC family sensor kinase
MTPPRDKYAADPALLLEAVTELARDLHVEVGEAELAARFLRVSSRLLPGLVLAVRVVDVRTRETARGHVIGGTLRDTSLTERLVLREEQVLACRVKPAVLASARLQLGDRWDSPLLGVGQGFAIPLGAGGEVYGVVDVGYPAGTLAHDAAARLAADEAAVTPLVHHLALALRGHRLHRDTLELRDYQSRLVEHANALIVGIDRTWRVTVCNRALVELTGVPRDEIIGRDLRDLLPADQSQRVTGIFSAALHGETRSAIDLVLFSRHAGRVRTVWNVSPVGTDSRGQPHVEAVVAIGQDRSKLHALEEQVIRAERLATTGQLAAGVVHEINNPLTSISVYADFLLKKLAGKTDDADLEKLRRIGAGAQRILRFAKELVQYARPAGNEVEIVSLNDVVRQALTFCEHLFDRGGIVVELELDPELPSVHAVPGQLEQVITNLVTNGAHALEAGGRLRVRTSATSDTVDVEVEDSGPGIPAAERERVFEPFFTTKPDGKGTGLGLPIVRNIVEQHHGTITLDSGELGGARFRVRLPGLGRPRPGA